MAFIPDALFRRNLDKMNVLVTCFKHSGLTNDSCVRIDQGFPRVFRPSTAKMEVQGQLDKPQDCSDSIWNLPSHKNKKLVQV